MNLLDVNEVSKLLANSKECIIGVSGGMDSMTMLHWLASNRAQLPCNIKAVHVDHGINESSNKWAEFVAATCAELDIELTIVKISLAGLGNNLEYAARKARYQAFCESGADTVLLAHHANDQCESFLLKLFRGSGLRGLKSMLPVVACWYDPNITIVRPMLNVSRVQIDEWAVDNNITCITDPSNHDNSYDRNYIRNNIWPTILDRFAIADVNTLRSVKHIEEAWQLTNVLADMDIATVTLTDGSLDWQKVRDLGYLRIKNMVMRMLGQEQVYTFSIGQVEQFAQGLVTADFDSRNQLVVKGLTMNKVGKKIVIAKQLKEAA